MNISEGCFSQVGTETKKSVNPQLSAGFKLITDPSTCSEGDFVKITRLNRGTVEAERLLFCAPELAALAAKNAQFEKLVHTEALRVEAVIASTNAGPLF